MSQTLQLEYQCTKEERSEATSLGLRKQLGGGSRAITLIVLLTVAVLLLVVMCFVIQSQTPRPYRPYVYIGMFVLVFFFFVRNRRALSSRKGNTTKVEVTENGLTLLNVETQVALPWSSFHDCMESPNLFVLAHQSKSVLLIVPKRVFPNAECQTWFRSLATNCPTTPRPPLLPISLPITATEALTLRFQLGLRDYLDRAVASYRTWGGSIGFLALIHGVFIYGMATAHPPPHPVFSVAQIYFIFLLPMTLLAAGIMFAGLTFQTWLSHKKTLIPQEVSLSDESVRFVSAEGTSVLPWSTYKYHKETRRSFIIWNPKGLAWALIPKRAFASADDVDRCRLLIANHLQKGRWFY